MIHQHTITKFGTKKVQQFRTYMTNCHFWGIKPCARYLDLADNMQVKLFAQCSILLTIHQHIKFTWKNIKWFLKYGTNYLEDLYPTTWTSFIAICALHELVCQMLYTRTPSFRWTNPRAKEQWGLEPCYLYFNDSNQTFFFFFFFFFFCIKLLLVTNRVQRSNI